ncbi:RluA family pseudouridine synthase [Fructilactobacillus sanfranciscensis]|uniref:RluA family pseudouridine synthase n=1 Tax=Fructilactobacillus sanfranciscensis TaxID=1625 RepID=UPI001EF15ECE|nr:RluA family pseudouridine synthase [Fructilactobacillus sanfranciscensis]MCG7195471.1 RluA family pseudouridine synthase [Fructilactobacillus sanfranciscensis]
MRVEWKNDEQQPISLKKLVTEHGVSHRMYQTLKENAASFQIQGQSIPANREIEPQEVVTVTFPPEAADPQVTVSHEPIDILYEDDNWLVINKPAGLTTVPGPTNSTDTLVNRIKGHLIDEKVIDLRPHIITRLDRFTSGVVLVAKNRLANSYANQQLADKTIDKRYLAIVKGQVADEHGIIDLPIGRVDDHFYREVTEQGKSSKTEYWVKKRLQNATVVEVKLHTGRTHQIRVHFTHQGKPLLGDELYHGPMNFGIERQALHAKSLKFVDPFQKQTLEFQAPIPADMQTVMEEGK